LVEYRLVIATNAKAAITNGYHMFACATGIDDITTVWYEKIILLQTVIKN